MCKYLEDKQKKHSSQCLKLIIKIIGFIFILLILLVSVFAKLPGLWNIVIGRPLKDFDFDYSTYSSPSSYRSIFLDDTEISLDNDTVQDVQSILDGLPYMRLVLKDSKIILGNKISLSEHIIWIEATNIYFYPDYLVKSGRTYVGNGYQEVYQALLDFCFSQIEAEADTKP